MSFLRHGEIYRPMSSSGSTPGRSWLDRPRPHRYDEFPAGYSLAGCAPAEPASASPAGAHLAAKGESSTIEMQRTANSVLTTCLNQGDNPKVVLHLGVRRIRDWFLFLDCYGSRWGFVALWNRNNCTLCCLALVPHNLKEGLARQFLWVYRTRKRVCLSLLKKG